MKNVAKCLLCLIVTAAFSCGLSAAEKLLVAGCG